MAWLKIVPVYKQIKSNQNDKIRLTDGVPTECLVKLYQQSLKLQPKSFI